MSCLESSYIHTANWVELAGEQRDRATDKRLPEKTVLCMQMRSWKSQSTASYTNRGSLSLSAFCKYAHCFRYNFPKQNSRSRSSTLLGIMPTSELPEVQTGCADRKCLRYGKRLHGVICCFPFLAASSLISPRRAKFEIVPNCSLFLVVRRRYGEHLNVKTRSPRQLKAAFAELDLLHWHYRLSSECPSDQLPLLFCPC